MANLLKLIVCLALPIAAMSLGCPKVKDQHVAKRESYCSSLPSNICGDKCSCSDDPYIQDGYYCDCRSCHLKTDCHALFNAGYTVSGTYRISPGGVLMDVYCDMNTTPSKNNPWKRGGWTVVQRRVDGSTNFYRGWENYQKGFGHLQNEHWLGNDNIHALTKGGARELWVEMTNFAGISKYARYSSFNVGNRASKYTLTVAGYSGDAGDSLGGHNGLKFTTYDQDNDSYSANCASLFVGAFWYGSCHSVNVNGKYFFGGPNPFAIGIHWHSFTGYHNSLKSVVMKIK